MASIQMVIKGRIEELPTLAQFSIDNYVRDKKDFEKYKPSKYVAGYLTNLQGQFTAVQGIVFPKQLTAELKLITERQFENMISIRPLMDHVEGYVRDAVGLTVGKKDFGISQVRKMIAKDDQEGLDSALSYLLNNIANNLAALLAVGYTVIEQTALSTLHTNINSDNGAQNLKEEERAQLVVDNMDVINGLAGTLRDLWADGKSIYKSTNKTKLKDYTNSQLIARIRQEELRTKITGVAMDEAGKRLSGAKVVARPLIGKRGKTVKCDKNGVYVLKGLKAGVYNITVTAKGLAPFMIQVEAVTNETVTVDLQGKGVIN